MTLELVMKIITFLFSIIILLQGLQAQTNTGSISAEATVIGKVSLAGEQRVGYAQVKVWPLANTTDITTVVADNTGSYLLQGLTTGVEDDNNTLPTDFKIKDVLVSASMGEAQQTYSKTIEKPDHVAIYDVRGAKVRDLLWEFDNNTTISSAFWDGKNNRGQDVAETMYFVRYVVDSDAFSAKIIHMHNGMMASNKADIQSAARMFKQMEEEKQQEVERQQQAENNSKSVNKITAGTPYVFEITPTDSSTALFSPRTIIRDIIAGFQQVTDTVYAITDKVDYTIKLENIYTTGDVAGLTVRWINDGQVVEEGISNAQGEIEFEDVKTVGEFTLEIEGGNEYISVAGFGFGLFKPQTPSDTARVQVYGIVPKNLPVPGEDGETVAWEKAEMNLRFGQDSNPEMHLGRKENLYLNGMNDQQKQAFMNLLAQGDSLFFMPNQEPWYRIVDTPRNITADMKQNYHPYNNYYEGELGWNISIGSNQTRRDVHWNGEEELIMGGTITIAGNPFGFYKELYGRLIDHTEMSSGFMALVSEEPTYTDRAYVAFRNTFKGYKWKNDGYIGRLNHYELEHLVE